MEELFAKRMQIAKASEIREILKLTTRPDIISFAGGLPAPELFPVEEMIEVSGKVLKTMGREALQYGPTEGYLPLRNHIVAHMRERGVEVNADNILILSGSQQGLDFSGKVFLDEGDVVFCESPSYLGALNAFRSYLCNFKAVETDENGMNLSDLEKKIEEAKTEGHTPKFVYVIPDFQNPSGKTWSFERRKGLYDIAVKHNIAIVEDNPYGALRFEGEVIPPIKSLDRDGRVVFLGTFSKTFTPGLRLGWAAASKELLAKFNIAKQAADLQASTISQRELSVFLDNYDFNGHVKHLIEVYKKRRDLMVETMKRTFPEGAKYVIPQGGLFMWVELPERIDTKKLLEKAIERKVAFVPGASFFPDANVHNCMRLNYSNMTEERIVEGIERLAELLKEELK